MLICKLCKKEKALIKKSHIIPDFMYKALYDDKHKIRLFSNNFFEKDHQKLLTPSTGEYESNLLCNDCDNKLLGSYYEGYANRVLYGGEVNDNEKLIINNCKDNSGIEFTSCKNVDYAKFKLFLLSILWRASISSRPFFKDIKLGPHEEKIREMIISKQPGGDTEYPILFLTYLNDKEIPKDLITQPTRKRSRDGHQIFIFIIAGMVYVYYTCSGDHKIPEYVLASTIKSSNEMNILHIPKGKGLDYLTKYLGIKLA